MTVPTLAASKPPPRLLPALSWGALILFETVAHVALRAAGLEISARGPATAWQWAGVAVGNPLAWVGAAGYLGAFFAWMVLLARMPLSSGYPLTAVVYVTVTAASFFVFDEGVGLLGWLGIGLIVGGITILGVEGTEK